MTRKILAIPAVTFLAVALSPSLSSQEKLVQVANSSISTAAQQPASSGLADEEMARLHMARKEYKEAEDIFYRLAVTSPKNPRYWNELGIAHHNQAQLDLALKCYQKAAKVDSHYADAQNNIGTVLYERKKFPKAIRAYKRAISLREDFAPFYLNLGYAYFSQKDFEKFDCVVPQGSPTGPHVPRSRKVARGNGNSRPFCQRGPRAVLLSACQILCPAGRCGSRDYLFKEGA
jgi:tetratricopeptide (TPR) repeat protein